MDNESNRSRWRSTWFLALGAGWAGVGILAVCYLLLGEPKWWQVLHGGIGWTIYPPLSAAPQAVPGSQGFDELTVAAGVCGAVFLGAWLVALFQRRRSWTENSRSPWFWLSLLLLLPLGVYVGGTYYAYQLKRDLQTQFLLQEYLQQYPAELDESEPVDSLSNTLNN